MLGLITLDNGEDHTKPNTFGPARRCSRSTRRSTRRWPTTRSTRSRVTGKPFILAAGADLTVDPGRRPRRRTRRRRARARGLPQAAGRRQAVVRVRQRPRPRRRPRGGAALHLPHRHGQRAGARPARGHARPGPRLGRRLPGAQPGRRRQGRHADRREPAQPGQDAGRPGGVRLRAGRRGLLRRRLPRAVAALGGRPCSRGEVVVERPEVDRGEAWDAASRAPSGIVAGQDRRRQPRRGRRPSS